MHFNKFFRAQDKNMCLILTVTCIPPRKCWAHQLVLWNIGQATNGQDNIVGWQTSCMEERIRSKQGMVDVELRKKSVALRASWVKKWEMMLASFETHLCGI